MIGDRNAPRSADDERKAMFGRLARTADRTVRGSLLKPALDSTVQMLREILLTEDAKKFSYVVQGLTRCGVDLPHKAPIYATIAGLLTAGNSMFAEPLARKLAGSVSSVLMSSMRDGRASVARRALRFLVCLCSCRVVSAESIVEYMRALLDAALQEVADENRPQNGPHARGPFFADIALSALPWGAATLAEHVPNKLAMIMELANRAFSLWDSSQWLSIASATASMCESNFVGLMNAIRELEQNEWQVPKSLIPNVNDEYKDELMEGQLVKLSQITVPSHSKRAKYSPPRFRLQLINDGDDVEMADSLAKQAEENGNSGNHGKASDEKMDISDKSEHKSPKDEDIPMNGDVISNENNHVKKEEHALAGTGSTTAKDVKIRTKYLNHYVKTAYVNDILDNFSTKHMMAAERLLTMPMLVESNNQIVEGMFSQMCTMPAPQFSCSYYGILFVDLCKVKDSRLPVKLLSAVETMFQQSGELDPETFDRLTDWFSFHLSNFGYKWNWSDWAVYADADMEEKFPFRALFCRDVLKRSIRLSYYDKVANLLPEEMKFFLPGKPSNGNTDRFDPGVNRTLMEIVTGSGKQPPEVVREKLLSLFPPSTNEDEVAKEAENKEANLARLAALIRAILQAGFKTLSHFDTVAERYIILLLEMTDTGGVEAKQLLAIEASVFWDSSHLRRMYVLDKLSTNGVIDWLSILDCVLSKNRVEDNGVVRKSNEEVARDLANSETWEIVRLVLSRALAREEGARLELSTATQLSAAATEGDAEALEARLERAKKATAHSVQEIKKCLHLVLQSIFQVCDMLLSSVSSTAEFAQDQALPGFNGAPLWAWRSLGMIRELGRKYPRHIGDILGALRIEVVDCCERHPLLERSFRLLQELTCCDVMHYAL